MNKCIKRIELWVGENGEKYYQKYCVYDMGCVKAMCLPAIELPLE